MLPVRSAPEEAVEVAEEAQEAVVLVVVAPEVVVQVEAALEEAAQGATGGELDPVMKEISEFWVDHLKALPDGTLVAPDGRSPEHGPEKSDGV